MVYRSFGRSVTQGDVWPAIAKVNRFGSLASTTHLMTRDAILRGFQAIAIGARDPIQVLRLCHSRGIRVILNQRLDAGSDAGHYTVMTGIDDTSVTLHDPSYGPSRVVSHEQLISLWQPRKPESEITGNALIAIGLTKQTDGPSDCPLCHTAIPSTFECPRCKQSIALTPTQVLSCISKTCEARNWNFVCCPSCDSLWDFQESAPEPEKASDSSGIPESVHRAFERLAEFIAHVHTVPGAAEHPDIREHLDVLSGKREGIDEAFDGVERNKELHAERMRKFQNTAEQNRAKHRQREESLKSEMGELDGNALGSSLLRELGFTG